MARGTLRIYLGASPGVGKTFAMLGEGRRRRDRGADVAVGVVETHGREKTLEQLGDLEVIPRRTVEHRGTVLTDMDLDAVLARRPEVVLVDEYAHTNAPGGRHEKRWQDVEALLDAGIDVISTLNVQHLESLNDVVSSITGIAQRETVPDSVVRRADQLELVDMSPEALRRRMAHGNIYPAERIDAALANFFRPGNLAALRELALLWLADRVEDSLSSYLEAHGIDDTWETRERVVVGLSGAPGADALVRRAARMAGRVGGDLIGVHVVSDDGLSRRDDGAIAAQRALVESLGGRTHEVVGNHRASALVEFARAEKATQLVIGATRSSRWHELVHGSMVGRVTRLARDVDVHVIGRTEDEDAAESPTTSTARAFRMRRAIDPRRVVGAWVLTVAGLPALAAFFHELVDVSLSTELLVFLTASVLIATLGGRLAGAVAAIGSFLLVNWFFVEPRYTLSIADEQNLVALVVFVAVTLCVGIVVNASAERALEARRARAEAAALARSAASLAADPAPVAALLDHVRTTFSLSGARLVSGEMSAESAEVIAEVGEQRPPVTVVEMRVDADRAPQRLELAGRRLTPDDRRVVGLLADQLAVAIENEQLGTQAATAAALGQIDAVRTAMLRAVSHDLRTPLATIKALVSGIVDPEAEWEREQLHEALVAVEQETDRLNRLVGNLLDASRLEIGALAVHPRTCSIGEVVEASLRSLGEEADGVVIESVESVEPVGPVEPAVPPVPVDGASHDRGRMPDVVADPILLERSLANVVSNAVRHSRRGSSDVPVRIRVEPVGDEVHVRVIDRGPGIPPALRDRVVEPFQRLGDTPGGEGVGLGLAISQGFVRAMHGRFELDDTPGGGLTVTIVLPAASGATSDEEGR